MYEDDEDDPGKYSRWDWDQIPLREKNEYALTVLALMVLFVLMYRLSEP